MIPLFGFLTLPSDLVSNVGSYSTAMFTSFAPIAAIVIGIGLGLYLISVTVRLFRGGGRRRR